MSDTIPQNGGPLILIADDDAMIRVLAKARLEALGFSIYEAQDGAQALANVQFLRPKLFVLDVMMPKMDGFTTCQELRSMQRFEHTPILMVTGLNDSESINRAYEAGATDFITKPINWVIFGHRVRYMWRATLVGDDLRRSESKNRALINAMPDLLFHIKKDGLIQEYKKPRGFELPWISDGLEGRNIDEAFGIKAGRRRITEHVRKAVKTGEMQVYEYQVKSGKSVSSFESRIVAGEDDDAIIIVRDITEKKKTEEQLFRLAYYDVMTGLLNRNAFKEHLSKALIRADHNRGLVTLLLMDIDRFKTINDTLGHGAGDQVLQNFADRLLSCTRQGDISARLSGSTEEMIVSRFGGDEFITLLCDVKTTQDAGKVARRILDSISRPFLLCGQEISITSSIGISVYPHDGDDVDSLLKNADVAMYHAKEQGRNNIQFYNESINSSAFERLVLENSLRRGLERKEFKVLYQPQVDLRTGRIVGCEALVRWLHPERGLVPPNQFIPLAEETGLIVQIGKWVLFEACSQAKFLNNLGLSFSPFRMSVNLSSHQFRQKDLLDMVAEALNAPKLDPQLLELEITESAIMQDADRAVELLKQLREMRIRIAIDDFGTGYSSLSYLKRFPLDVLKIDSSFIKDMTVDSQAASITAAIITLAQSLGLEVVAEGVETREHLSLLCERGCDIMQGYLFSPPVEIESIEKMIRERRRLEVQ